MKSADSDRWYLPKGLQDSSSLYRVLATWTQRQRLATISRVLHCTQGQNNKKSHC